MSKSKTIAWFISIEAGLYVLFLTIDIFTAYDSTPIKYASIILCFLASLTYLVFDKKIDKRLVINIALFLTVIADLFLLVLDNFYAVGVAFFAVAQTAYAVYLHFDKKHIAKTVILRTVLITSLLIFAWEWLGFSWLVCFVIYYFVNLVVNLGESCFFASKTGLTFATGLMLLTLCDICVGLNNITNVSGISLPNWLNDFVDVAMWAFYLPSQVLIAVSIMEKK